MKKEISPHAAFAAAALLIASCEELEEKLLTDARPLCDSERIVEGWAVTASVGKTASDSEIYNKWEVRRNFSAHFGLRISYDTSDGPAPFLQIWHDYKSGDFVMRLADGSHFRLMLRDQYAVSSAPMPESVFEDVSRYALRIEHTSNTNKWSVYRTTGLPEAIAAAHADLDSAKRRLSDGDCRTVTK